MRQEALSLWDRLSVKNDRDTGKQSSKDGASETSHARVSTLSRNVSSRVRSAMEGYRKNRVYENVKAFSNRIYRENYIENSIGF